MRSHLLVSFAGLLLAACGAPEATPAVTVEADVPQEAAPVVDAPLAESPVAAEDDVLTDEAPTLPVAEPFHSLECAATEVWDATMPCVDGGACDVVLLQGECGLVAGLPPIVCFAHTAHGWIPCGDAIAQIEGAAPADLNARIEAQMGIAVPAEVRMIPQVEACARFEGEGAAPAAELTHNGISFDIATVHHTACVEGDKPFSWGGAPGQGVVTVDIDLARPGCAEALTNLPAGLLLVSDEHGDGLASTHFGLTAVASGNLADLLTP